MKLSVSFIKQYSVALVSLFIVLATQTGAYAGTTTASSKATATLGSNCSISATGINFGSITQSGSSQQLWAPSQGNISVLCTNKTTYKIALNMGSNKTGDSRYLVGNAAGQSVLYTICQSASFSGTLGNGGSCALTWRTSTSGVDIEKSGTGTGAIQSYPMYGIVNTGYYTPDTYSDTITATLTY
jgi:spore coat protein U-like protein